MSTTYALQQESLPLQRRLKQLVNEDLKRILREEDLSVTGVKAQLQQKIISRLQQYVDANDVYNFNRMRYFIYNPKGTASPSNSNLTSSARSEPHTSAQSSRHVPAGYQAANGNGLIQTTRSYQLFPARVHFKESPFYEIEGNVTMTAELPKCEQYRQSQSLRFEASPAMFDDPSKRVMLYCAEDPVGGGIRSNVIFPQHIELKVNNQDVKVNSRRGKKPTSVNPTDITPQILRSQSNFISITVAQTSKRFYMMAVLVKKRTVDELVERIRRGRIISKQTVQNEMRTKAADPDIIATSTVMSLKCPVSTMRIGLPCRSTVCTHNSCFDATSFLQLQEQGPTWTCPICQKAIDFGGLAVDQYVEEILQFTSKSTDQVIIEPNGDWKLVSSKDNPNNARGEPSPTYSGDDDDDIVEITDHRITNIKNEMANSPGQFGRTPPASSREASTPTSANVMRSGGGGKRKSEVIDLTLSSDEDEPIRPPKRYHHQQVYSNPPATSSSSHPNLHRQHTSMNGYDRRSSSHTHNAGNGALPSPSLSNPNHTHRIPSTSSSFTPFHMPNHQSTTSSHSHVLPQHTHHNHHSLQDYARVYAGYIPGSSSSPPNS